MIGLLLFPPKNQGLGKGKNNYSGERQAVMLFSKPRRSCDGDSVVKQIMRRPYLKGKGVCAAEGEEGRVVNVLLDLELHHGLRQLRFRKRWVVN